MSSSWEEMTKKYEAALCNDDLSVMEVPPLPNLKRKPSCYEAGDHDLDQGQISTEDTQGKSCSTTYGFISYLQVMSTMTANYYYYY